MLLTDLRLFALAACSLTSITTVYADVLSSAEYLDLTKSDINPDDYWTLTSDEVTDVRWGLGQNDTNGRSMLGSFNAPKYNKFISSSRRRQTTAPWGSRTALSTDPYTNSPDTGVVRSYDFTLARATLAPDGVQRSVMLINGQFPGPTIEANWGDTISVTVHNNLGNEGTTIHWHGMLQTNTNDQDGVPGITQCPIAPGQSYTYTFKASLYGTTWYHAHYSAQYTAGLYGAIIVHGPTDNASYDIDLGPVLLTDYYYQDYYSTVKDVMGTDLSKVSPFSDNNLINGKGITNCAQTAAACTPNAGLSSFRFQKGKTHRLRLINAGVEAIQKFSIDNHVLTIMAIDFVPVVPYQTTIVTLGVGQRVDVLVQANGNPTDSVFMRSTIPTCSKAKQPNGLALVFYQNADTTSSPTTTATVDTTDPCSEDTLAKAVAYYSITPTAQPDITYHMDITVGTNATGNVLWSVNNSTFRADYNTPILSLLQSGQSAASLPTTANVVDFGSAKSVRLVITNLTPLSHPMHIHGSDMYVLAAGGTVNTATTGQVYWDGSTLVNAANPLRRDTFMLQPNGYMVAQFDATNPGVWPFHCHIAWHVSGGLYSNFVTQSSAISSLSTSSGIGGLCAAWNAFSGSATVDQIDSGLKSR